MSAAEGEKAPAPAMPIPNFSDIGKAANDLMNKDFYHNSQANLEVKLKAPSGTNITVKGKQDFNAVTSGSVEAKHAINKGVVLNQSWTTGALSDTKIELTDVIAPGVKVDLQHLMSANKEAVPMSQKITAAFKNPNVHSRAFFTHMTKDGNVDAVVDVTAGHEGFLVGAEAGYNLQKAAVTKYSLALGYQTPSYIASIVGMQNLSVISAGFYQKVNSSTEVGIKTGYDVQGQKATGVEIASKYKLDPLSFAKVKVNDRGIAALAYNTKLNAGTTLGLGMSLDTAKLNEAGHKIGTSLTFEG